MRRRPLCAAAVIASALAAGGAAAPISAPQPPSAASAYDACAPRPGQAWTYDQLLCLYIVGMRERTLDQTRERLRRLGGGADDQPWPTLVLGYATQGVDQVAALALYKTAAAGFVRAKEAEGEVLARNNLRIIHFRRGEIPAAAQQVELAVAAADASGAPLAIARASVMEASHLIETGGDLGRAYRTLRRADGAAASGAPLGLQRSILINLANASIYLGRIDDAIDALERHRALRQQDGATTDAANVAFNLLSARLAKGEATPTAAARAQLVTLAATVLAEAEDLNRTAIVAYAHRVLGDLLRSTDAVAAAAHLGQCLELEKSIPEPELRAGCLWSLSLHAAGRDPSKAERLSRDAVAALTNNPNGPLLAQAWQARLRLVWQTMEEDAAIQASMQALDAIERLRSAQREEGVRAALFSNWTRDYYWLAGRLLSSSPSKAPEAFAVGERLRSRVLLEHLSRAGVETPIDPTRRAQRQDIEQRIADTQRRLLQAPDEETRRALLDRLEALEIDERGLAGGAATAGHAPTFASIQAVQRVLADDEAMLWFSIAPWEDLYGDFGGGAWLVSITRSTATVHRLPSPLGLDAQVEALTGLLRDREAPADRWSIAAAQLGDRLLGEAIRGLPPITRRLVIVGDGPLHRAPFEVLRTAAGGPTLGERFETSMAPSATVWLQLRGREATPRQTAALVLADPALPAVSPLADMRLDPLPFARREAWSVARMLHLDATQVREGRDASERFLKRQTGGSFGVLHLAAHARADDAFPDRSAVFLAPGDAAEDGWLQPREIAALDLSGGLVVLSACESAGGFVLSGEGPLSLARAFFAGGARAVVATRWPLRDDDAAFVMQHFYRALSEGATVSAALARARREAIAEGRPAEAWASLVLLGDGLRPAFAAPMPTDSRQPVAVLAIVATMMGAVIVWAFAMRRRAGAPIRFRDQR